MCKLKSVLVTWLALVCFTLAEDAKSAKDSYMAALQNSHQINDHVRIAREDYNGAPPVSSYEYSFTPSNSYNVPPTGYGAPPKPAYGPPKPVYGPPAPAYGPPAPAYGPPAPASHGVPYLSPETWLLNKIKFKFNWFTLAKILLKIVIFKKIVKFIALLCLLFFIPTLKPSESDDDHSGSSGDHDHRRSYDLHHDYNRRLTDVTNFALKAMEAFTIDNEIYCPEENLLSCRAKRMFDAIDEAYPLQQIFQMYVTKTNIRRSHSERAENVGSNGIDQITDDNSNSNEGVEQEED
ncbi:uncharacterized protein LOC129762953 isoform X2 [Toxorhynchites rutilus septentrionalis]|uniref:uncharacterized protein LOC129762953 isoform X2 n=1 Tax=Toxorhynchites rutilus septentrionalis TaxID=329112 RepID=UPI00247B0C21|nr:uncharacterized protein LOC129762953 isoform X2 [Toxorhynchites rutilus septentrionalis]